MGNLYLQYKEGFPDNLNDVFIETETKNQITYADLEKHSAAYSVGFKKLGLNRGDRVTLQVDKSVEVFFIYLACLRSGLIFHPLNTAYKDSELRFFLNDAEPTVFICESTIFNKIESPVFTWQFRLRMTKTRRDVAAKGKNFDIQKVSRKTD